MRDSRSNKNNRFIQWERVYIITGNSHNRKKCFDKTCSSQAERWDINNPPSHVMTHGFHFSAFPKAKTHCAAFRRLEQNENHLQPHRRASAARRTYSCYSYILSCKTSMLRNPTLALTHARPTSILNHLQLTPTIIYPTSLTRKRSNEADRFCTNGQTWKAEQTNSVVTICVTLFG